MYQQYVYGVANCCPLVVYELYILCCYIIEYNNIFQYKNMFEYKNVFYRGMVSVNQQSMHLHSVTISKI